PYEASHYDVEVDADPSRAELRGRTVVAIRSLEKMETASLRLDGNLQVESVRSSVSGSHQFLQQKGRDTLLVRFQPPLEPGSRAALEVRYGGVLEPQGLAAVPGEPQDAARAGRRDSGHRGTLLYSNRVYWFPQSPVRNHTTATLTVTVPAGYTALASGALEAMARDATDGSRKLLFRTETPIRYLSLLIGRLDPVEITVSGAPVPVDAVSVPARARRARALFAETGPILRFFSSLIGEVPYPRLTLAFLDTMRPAAHSPAYLALFGEPAGWIPASAGDSPTHFSRQPVFHVAHEIAHQWWGQAVGWRNYRDQWLSEALAQYFAALYVRDSRGEDVFRDVLAWMHRWVLEGSGKGPVSLGFRVGQVTSCEYCFAAVVYNRGAFVLHMLRKLLGDDAFFRGLRLYYGRWRFLRAGTDDLRAALEESSGRNLQRFFEQWIRDDKTPELLWSVRRLGGPGQPQVSLRVEQRPEAFELPVAVTIEYDDRPPSRRFLHVQRSREEFSFELEGRLRRIRLNETFDALCRLREVKP
ncbi:MAG: M1 family aminopeptidase, partial [Thermoanaerobaculia bacterium]